MNEQEWRATGKQAKKVREELFKLQRTVSGKIPVSIVKHVKNAIDDVDRFRNVAEERMLNSGGPSDLSIFYGQESRKKEGPEFLWDLNLEEIPLGWEERYQQELKDNPNGRYESIPEFSSDGAKEYTVFYDPVGYRKKLLLMFKEIQGKAKAEFEKEEDFKLKMHNLLKLDIALYNLLDEWVTDDWWDVSCMDPFKIEDDIKGTSEYFSEEHTPKGMKRYMNLKLFTLTNI